MKKIQIHLVLLLLFLPFVSWAQLDSAGRAQIREVQQNYGLYFRGDATASTAAKAMERAERALWQEVEQYADTAKATVVNTSAVTDKMQKVTVARGDQFRAFAYVRRSDVIASSTDKLEKTYTPPQVQTSPKLTAGTPSSAEGLIGQLKRIGTLSELQAFLVKKKEEGAVLNYNRYTALEDASAYYLVVYALDRKIMAVLSPGREERLNIGTGRPDSMENYKGCGAIAVLLSKSIRDIK